MAANSPAPVQSAPDAREMTKADICNVEPPSDAEARFLKGADQLAITADELQRIAEVEKLNEALRGLLRVNPNDSDGKDAAAGYVSADDGRHYENGIPPVEFALDWQSHVSQCGGDIAATVLHHLRWNIAEHQKLLDATVKRLREAKLVGADEDETARWGLTEGGAQ